MRILLIGEDAITIPLAQNIEASSSFVDLIFLTSLVKLESKIISSIDIKSNDIDNLVDFAEANEIDLTIVCNKELLKENITDKFNDKGLMIFAPDTDASYFCYNRTKCKKLMYRLKIPTAKFGTFEKTQQAIEYLRKASFPQLIHLENNNYSYIVNSFSSSVNILTNFNNEEHPIVTEHYVVGDKFNFYIITDGYNILPLIATVPYKYAMKNEFGRITKNLGAYAPANFVDKTMQEKIISKFFMPIINDFATKDTPYIGILGVNITLDYDNNMLANEFYNYFQEADINCALNLLDTNIVKLMQACLIGSLKDDYADLSIKEETALSVALTKIDTNLSAVKGLDMLDEDVNLSLYQNTKIENVLTLKQGLVGNITQTAKTLTSAKKLLSENIDFIEYDGKNYYKDILKQNND